MGTRGAIGFFSGEVTKVTYNHFDSYPEGLGKDLAKWGSEQSLEELRSLFPLIRLVQEDGTKKPTGKEVTECIKEGWYSEEAGNRTTEDWYNLLRKVQGQLEYLKKFPVMIDYEGFLSDSLFCEWAYIFNLDTGKMEVYKGFQESKGQGRYTGTDEDKAKWKASYPGEKYFWGVSLVTEFEIGPDLNTKFQEWLEARGEE